MGLAIIIPNADFKNSALGKVTISEDIELTHLTIVGNSNVVNSATFEVVYHPITTNQKGVVWSIVQGSEFANISQSGVVTVKQGAEGTVLIRATSSINPSIYVDKTISVRDTKIVPTYDYHYEIDAMNGTSEQFEDTGVKLFSDENTKWCLFVFATKTETRILNETIFACVDNSLSPWPGVRQDLYSGQNTTTMSLNDSIERIYYNPISMSVTGTPSAVVEGEPKPYVIIRDGNNFSIVNPSVNSTPYAIKENMSIKDTLKNISLKVGGDIITSTPERFAKTTGKVEIALMLGVSNYYFDELFAKYD